ncbi:MAG TPA: hypothetical protein VK892_15380 [Pyrinomonadaceae bacterium]|nr:hypothetical protein [Pyrinomonadaceae bacterium]
MKRKVEYTTPALLAGIWQLLAIIDALHSHTTAELEEMAQLLLEMIGTEQNLKNVKELV